jgi:hypothetical protein
MSKRKIGRPTAYSEELASEICLAIATSNKGLARICSGNREFPNCSTIYRWLLQNPTFREQYARAKEFQAQALFDELIEISDTPRMGSVVKVDPKGKKSTRTGDMVDRARLQIDARKWTLSKLLPARYGDRLDLGTGSPDPLDELIKEMQKESERIGGPETDTEKKLLQ